MHRAFRHHALRLATVLWVAAPILGYWPGATPKASQMGWWVLASIVVIAVGMTQPVRRTMPGFGWGMSAVLAVVFSHLAGIGFTIGWAYQVSLLLCASWVLAERAEFAWIRQTVIGLAWVQVGLVGLEGLGVQPFPVAGNFPHGSLATRTGLCLLWTMASLWSPPRSALVLALLAAATGSFTSTIALVRVICRSRTIPFPLLLSAPVWLVAVTPAWGPRFLSRWEVWTQMTWLQTSWLAGWGFLPFISGFVSADTTGAIGRLSSVQIFMNNTWLDWVGRTGLIGALLLAALAVWASRRLTTPWRAWTAAGLVWMGLWQSAEVYPVLSLLGVCSVIGLAQEG